MMLNRSNSDLSSSESEEKNKIDSKKNEMNSNSVNVFSSSGNASLFSPDMNKMFKQLQQWSLEREPFRAGEILLKHPHLLTEEGKLKDGFLDEKGESRAFKSVSPIKYAAWSLDTPMLYWLTLHWSLSFVPDHNFHKQEALAWLKSIKKKNGQVSCRITELKEFLDKILNLVPDDRKMALANHLNELETKSTEYGKHYDFSILLSALKNVIVNWNEWNGNLRYGPVQKSEERRNAALEMLQKAQYQITLYLVHEYCNPGKFMEVEQFNKNYCDHLPRTDYVHYHNKSEKIRWSDLVKYDHLKGAIVKLYADPTIFKKAKDLETSNGDLDVYMGQNYRGINTLATQGLVKFKELLEQLNPKLVQDAAPEENSQEEESQSEDSDRHTPRNRH